MEQTKAITWIRDGALIDRMPENATAFAIAAFEHLRASSSLTLEDLINWCFENSGISATEKMKLLNATHNSDVFDIGSANAYYTYLAEAVGPLLKYFDGAPELIQELAEKGVRNYITSAINQKVLDVWGESNQGRQVSSNLEILGDGEKGQKGEGHFKHIREQDSVQIYSVADAESEIRDSAQYADVAIGFAHVITRERVVQAFERVRPIREDLPASLREMPLSINPEDIILPEEQTLVDSLKSAGAQQIITGDRSSIMGSLRGYFEGEGLV